MGLLNKMKVLRLNVENTGVDYTEVNVPVNVPDTHIIVKVAYSGICGTDLHIMDGSFKAKKHVTLGHEFSGTVVAVPEGVKSLSVGDKVVINPNRYCGICLQCRRGQYNLCKVDGGHSALGVFNDGGWAEYCSVPLISVFKVNDSTRLDHAALAEPLSCIIHAFDRCAPFEIDANVLVIGAGIIGVLWCCILHSKGIKNVFISEPNENRRRTVNELNLGYMCASWNEIQDYQNSYPDWEIDICIDCSGNINAMQSVFPFLRVGAKFCVFGVASRDARLSISPRELFEKEIKIIGSVMNTNESMYKAIAMLQALGNKYFDFGSLGIKVYNLWEYEKAFSDLKAGKYSKVVFQM